MAKHVVVDGSNIATEGRAMPSLKQLNDAVMAYIQDHPDDVVTVVVDATFGHRIDPTEVPEFDAAVENNELVSPPAGAIGRGDAFVLTIANKAGATILSNDSFQEFHGDYPWLFDEGRLIGGKPVPHVGWVFVPRAPVRGPISRRAVRDRAKAPSRSAGRPSKLASQPLPAPKIPPPTRGRRKAVAESAVPAASGDGAGPTAEPAKSTHAPSASKQAAINELLPFLAFVEQHPVGTPVEAITESYSSHGAYVRIGDVRAYAPLRFLGDPPPRSAREVLALGATAPFVVVSFNAPRRGIDLAAPGFVPAGIAALAELPAAGKRAPAKRTRKKAAAVEPAAVETPAVPEPTGAETPAVPAPAAVEKPAAAKRTRKKAAVTPAEPVEAPAPAKKAPAKRATRAKKAAVAKAVEPAPVPPAAPTPAPAPAKRTRKAATKKAVASTTDGDVAGAEAPAKKAAKKTAKRTTKKSAAVG